jgi:hypothetical protein
MLPVQIISQCAPSPLGDWWRKGGGDHNKWCNSHLIWGRIIDNHQKISHPEDFRHIIHQQPSAGFSGSLFFLSAMVQQSGT